MGLVSHSSCASPKIPTSGDKVGARGSCREGPKSRSNRPALALGTSEKRLNPDPQLSLHLVGVLLHPQRGLSGSESLETLALCLEYSLCFLSKTPCVRSIRAANATHACSPTSRVELATRESCIVSTSNLSANRGLEGTTNQQLRMSSVGHEVGVCRCICRCNCQARSRFSCRQT
jgi:hypothetical protein